MRTIFKSTDRAKKYIHRVRKFVYIGMYKTIFFNGFKERVFRDLQSCCRMKKIEEGGYFL